MEGDELTIEELVREAARLVAPAELDPDEVTVKMFVELVGDITVRKAIYRLDTMVDMGLLEKRKVHYRGHRRNVYKPAIEGGWRAVVEKLKE